MMASEMETQGQDLVECDLCEKPVSFFCRGCRVNLCDLCTLIHLRVKSKNGHDVVDYTSKDDTCFCDLHPQNDGAAYCITCDIPICILCVSIKHKSHDISELSDKVEKLSKVITQENNRIHLSKCELENILQQITKQLASISLVFKQRKDEVSALGDEWHKHIDNTLKTLHRELDVMQKEHESVLQNQIKEFQEKIREIDDLNKISTKLQKSHNVKEMQKLILLFEKQETPIEYSQYSFKTFPEYPINTTYLQTHFGCATILQEKKISLLGRKEENELLCRKTLEVPTVTFIIDSGFPADETYQSRLYDIALSHDNKIWLGGSSKELKLFDLEGNLHHTVGITCKGMFICSFDKQIIFSDIENKNVKKVSDTDTVVTMFTTGAWIPRGIASTTCGELLVCLDRNDESKVVRYSSTGTVIQEIRYDSQCLPLYQKTNYITENVNGDVIVSDWKKKAVIVVDKLGIFRYSYLGIDRNFNVGSVANDSVGHIFVADYGGNKIHMLDRDGKFLKYIHHDGEIKRPRAVCILDHGDMMVGECLTGIAKRIKY